MITTADADGFEDAFRAFVELFPGRPWGKRVDAWSNTKSKNPFRAALLRKAQPVIFGIAGWEARYMGKECESSSDEMLISMSFVAQIVELNKSGGDRNFLSRVQGALKKSHDMRALLFELQVAVHFFRQRCLIEWSSENSGSKVYDMMVVPESMDGLEVECKSFSFDKGEENTVEERLAVLDRIVPVLKEIMPIQAGCICSLGIEFKGKIPKGEADLNTVAQKIITAVGLGESVVDGVCHLGFSVYEVSEVASKQSLSAGEVGRFLERVSGRSSCVVMKPTDEGGWMAFSAANARASRLKKAILADAKYAIREQMSGSRPGCLAIQLDAMVGNGMVEVFHNENSMLHELAAELFDDVKHSHLAIVLFASRPSLNVVGEFLMAEEGIVAVYENKRGVYINSGYAELFAREVSIE